MKRFFCMVLVLPIIFSANCFAMTFPIYKDEAIAATAAAAPATAAPATAAPATAAPATAAPATAAPATTSLEKSAPAEKTLSNETLKSPLTGNLVAIADVPDPVFSSGALGQGIAVEPTEGKVFAPADAEVTTMFPTGHAIGLLTNKGTEILIHIGMDTVNMEGRGFVMHVSQGDKVKQGQLLIEFDINLIKKEGHPIITPVIVTNTASYKEIKPVEGSTIKNGQDLISTVV